MMKAQCQKPKIIQSALQGKQWLDALVEAEGGPWVPDDVQAQEEARLLANALVASDISASKEEAYQFWIAVSEIFNANWLGFDPEILEGEVMEHLEICAAMILEGSAFVDFAPGIREAYLNKEGHFARSPEK